MTVPGYPNFVIMYGPNTNGGEISWYDRRSTRPGWCSGSSTKT